MPENDSQTIWARGVVYYFLTSINVDF